MLEIGCGGSCVEDWLWRLMCWGLAMCWKLAVEAHVLRVDCGGSCVEDWLWRLMC